MHVILQKYKRRCNCGGEKRRDGWNIYLRQSNKQPTERPGYRPLAGCELQGIIRGSPQMMMFDVLGVAVGDGNERRWGMWVFVEPKKPLEPCPLGPPYATMKRHPLIGF